MKKIDVIIVGGGLGGLECGALLCKEGLSVLVLEQSPKSGGFFQPFKRNGHLIDSSVHYIGSLDKGELLHDLFKYLGISNDVNLMRLDSEGFDNVHLEGKKYPVAMGHDQFSESLSVSFPGESKNINSYIRRIKVIGKETLNSVLNSSGISGEAMKYLSMSAYDEIERVFQNRDLLRVLTGNSIIYGGERQMTPFYVHAITTNSYFEGAYRFVGGADQLTTGLERKIFASGGEVRCSSRVNKIITENNMVKGVELANGEIIESTYVISSLHPSLTLGLIDDNNAIRPVFRNRISSLKNSYGLFCLYLIMKKGAFPYMNSNHFIFNGADCPDSLNIPPQGGIMVSMQVPVNDIKYAEVVSIMRPMYFGEVEKWDETQTGRRGDDYSEFKEREAGKMIDIAESRFPGIRSAISSKYSATPLTFRDYLSAPEGSAYGIMKNYANPLSTIVQPKTKIGNLFLTGQSLNLHGVMGVTITSLLTCYEILGAEYLSTKIVKSRS